MSSRKILYVCQEVAPYVPETEEALTCRRLSQAMQEREIRTFMPRYGCINERRHQLHEVIRLSGMNLIIDDNDHQLIIKVASIPSARVQIYFIDNDDYFSRKAVLSDEETGKAFADNDERAVFFARGVLETVKKLQWVPSIVHCHGWFSSIVPIYLKRVFADDPIFKEVKIVVSLYDDAFEGALGDMKGKIAAEGVVDETLKILDKPTYENLYKYVLQYVDGVVLGSEKIKPEVIKLVEATKKPVLKYLSEEADLVGPYNEFYDAL